MENTPDTPCGKTSPVRSVQTTEKISELSSKNSARSKIIQPLFLDLRQPKENGEQQGLSWQTDIHLLGESSMHNFGEFPNAVEESSLWQILEVEVPEKYYLSKRACRGVLQRAAKRGVELPPILLTAIISQGEITEAELTELGISPPQLIKEIQAVDTYNYAISEKTRTLLAGHYDKDGLPCVAINLLQDAVPNENISPCVSTGNPKTGQANIGVVYAIDRAAFNQGQNAQYKIQVDENGIAHTLVAKGPGAVCVPIYGVSDDNFIGVGKNILPTLKARDYKSPHFVSFSQNSRWIVRRVTPTECARLQGMPDWWCDGVKHFDSAEYKMWGNGMALPCVMYIMQNLSAYYRKNLLGGAYV